MSPDITIRKATRDDAEFLALGFLTAMWVDEKKIPGILAFFKTFAERDDTLYSWRNAYIATYNGEDAGVLISYDGAIYKEAALITFTLLKEANGEDYTQMTQEAIPGEWYLDTLAVMPQYRRKGIARALLLHGIMLAKECEDTSLVTLYVDAEHPWVVDLYSSMGFQTSGEAFIFNQMFTKMSQSALKAQ